jgi:ribosomal protein S6
MEKLMSKYETIFIINPDFSEEATKAVVEKFTGLITENEAVIDNISEWGKRRLAYPIDDFNDGYYVLINFTSKATFPAELSRIYNITDGILRSLIVKIEA